MANKSTKLLTSLSNTRTRTFVILFGAIIVVGVGVAITRSGNEAETDVLASQGSQAASVPTAIKTTPGTVAPEKYRELQQAENLRRAEEAMQKKTSAIPTIIGAIAEEDDTPDSTDVLLEDTLKGPTGDVDPNLQLEGIGEGGFSGGSQFGKSPLEKAREEQEAKLREQREAIDRQRQQQLAQQEAERQRQLEDQAKKDYEASVQKLNQQMKTYAQGAYSDWAKITPQAYVQGELAEKEYQMQQEALKAKGTVQEPSASTTRRTPRVTRAGGRDQARIVRKKEIIKAGTVMYGVLDTAINSDEKGPILCSVVSGKYRGSKMVGTLTHEGQQESVVVTFTQMSIPKYSKSVSVQVAAIDPVTARTALASDVDRHYLLRYGSLFASSFISGYGKAINQEGTTTTSPLTGATTTTRPELSGSDKILSALGEVGTQWSQQTRQFFNTPYTVTVDQGTSVGLLFLNDVELSSELFLNNGNGEKE